MKEKISKICWNYYGWKRPSGTDGKSSSSVTYENAEGFGHEEWLFDKSKIVNGFHYGFLQPLYLKSDKHVGQTYKLWLYTITNKQKFLVGYLDNAICISKNESIEIYNAYKRNGWVKEMVKDLKIKGINPIKLNEMPPKEFFNIKFKIKDIKIYDDFPVISNSDPNLTTLRYKLLDKISDFKIETLKQKDTDSYFRKATSEIFVDLYHKKIQNTLSKLLSSNRQYYNIKTEKDNIDIQATSTDGTVHYFEIKTDTPKNNIRQAIGQLFEYSMFPDKQKAQRLIIVGDCEPTADVKKYIRHLRNKTTLNLFYRWVDMDNETLSNEI